MTMNRELAAMYGTGGEELAKQAEVELFCKLAAEQGVDLNTLQDEQINELYAHVFSKTAEEGEETKAEEKAEEKKEEGGAPPFAKKEEEEKKEAASREHAVKLAQADEEARAHYLGQVMAHSYVAELSKIAAAREAEQTAAAPAAEAAPAPAEGTKEAAMPENLAKALGKVKGAVGAASDKASKHIAAHPKASVGAAAGGGYLGGRAASGKKKEGSAIDALALEAAVKIAAADGRFDLDEVATRIGHVHGLGLAESTKVASTLDAQVEVRALEYLEAAGYPVEWAS